MPSFKKKHWRWLKLCHEFLTWSSCCDASTLHFWMKLVTTKDQPLSIPLWEGITWFVALLSGSSAGLNTWFFAGRFPKKEQSIHWLVFHQCKFTAFNQKGSACQNAIAWCPHSEIQTYTYTHIYIYIYLSIYLSYLSIYLSTIYVCACVCEIFLPVG